MSHVNFNKIFADSFEDFKVFENLDASQASMSSSGAPNSIWQILNHLIIWQDYLLKNLKGIPTPDINEMNTWVEDKIILDNNILSEKIEIFHHQIQQIKDEIKLLKIDNYKIEENLKTIQDMTIHLSFHIGEIVLIRRQLGQYPFPSEMKDFLTKDKNSND